MQVIKKVKIPKSVTSIDSYAFKHSGLESFIHEQSDDLERVMIGKECFSGCDNLSEVIFSDNMKMLNTLTFSGCEKLEKLVLPKDLKTMHSSSIAFCKNLKEIYLPRYFQTMEENAIMDCPNITRIYWKGISYPQEIAELKFKSHL